MCDIIFKVNGQIEATSREHMAECARHLPQPHRDVLNLYYGLFDGDEREIYGIMDYFDEYENCPWVMSEERIGIIYHDALRMAAVDLPSYKPTSKPRSLTKRDYYYSTKLPLAGRSIDHAKLQLIVKDAVGNRNLELIDAEAKSDGYVDLDYVLEHREGLLILAYISWSDVDFIHFRGLEDPAAEDYDDLIKERFGFADFCIAPTLSSLFEYDGILIDGEVDKEMDAFFISGLCETVERLISYLDDEAGKPAVADIDLADPKVESMLDYMYLDADGAAKLCFFNTFSMSDMVQI